MATDNEFVKKRAPTLYVIIAIKLLKGALFVALAIVAWALSDNDLPVEFQHLLHLLRLNPERKFFINLAVQVKDQLVKTGKVAHARLGIEIQSLSQSLANSFNLKTPNGALVAKVDPDSAAARAGIKPGDVILKFNGEAVFDSGQLSARVGMTMPGDQATLQVWRDGKTLDLSATIGTAQSEKLAQNDRDANSDQGKLGLALRPLNQAERRESGLASGLVVEDPLGWVASR